MYLKKTLDFWSSCFHLSVYWNYRHVSPCPTLCCTRDKPRASHIHTYVPGRHSTHWAECFRQLPPLRLKISVLCLGTNNKIPQLMPGNLRGGASLLSSGLSNLYYKTQKSPSDPCPPVSYMNCVSDDLWCLLICQSLWPLGTPKQRLKSQYL